MELINLHDYEKRAQEVMEPTAWDYFAGGPEDEYTLADNCEVFRRIKFRPRMLIDVSKRDLSTTVLGHRLSMPVMIAPTTYQRLAHPDAELAVVRAASAVGTIGIFSTGCHYSIEEIVAASSTPVWFQLYAYENRTITERLVRRAENAGCSVLMVTVDASYPRRHERGLRRPLIVPPDIEMRTLIGIGLNENRTDEHGNPIRRPIGSGFYGLTWDDIAWLRKTTKLPMALKGIITAEDAVKCLDYGVDGIVVSNHGARQVDTTMTAMDALPEIVDAVGSRMEIMMDGGIRRGADVLKAIAFGAKAVLIGRPFLWGLAVNGEPGVRHVLEILREEMDLAMAQLGRPTIASIDRSMVVVR